MKNMNRKFFRRILAAVLVFTLVFTSSAISYADDSVGDPPSEKEIINELNDGISNIANNAGEANALADDAEALTALQSAFKSFMSVASTVGTILSVVNGSVTFLRMIGAIKDPTQQALMDINVQLGAINDTVNEMNQKLNDITNRMATLQASEAFNARTLQAQNLRQNWNDFTYRYCETGMDELMDEYNSMYLNGMIAWCKNNTETSRIIGDVDNTSIYILYKKTSSGYQLTYSDVNGIPGDFTKDDRYIIISPSRIPQSVEWDADNYLYNIETQLRDSISSALLGVDHSGVTVYNYQELYDNLNTRNQAKYINQIVEDAISTLAYRISSAEINQDASFTRNVISTYRNYCSHLQAAEEGLDAIIKTFYLTHTFESEISEDLTEFCNLYSVKNGVYGVFVANVLGASETATSAEKTAAVTEFNDSVKFVQQAKDNSLTGYDNFNYITDTRTRLGAIQFNGSESVVLQHLTNGQAHYVSSSASAITTSFYPEVWEDSFIMNDVQVVMLNLYAQSNGSKMDYSYLVEHTSSSSTEDYGKIITSYGTESAFNFDGTTSMLARVINGDYFTNGVIRQLPSKASAGYLQVKTKISGNTYDMQTGTISSGDTLFAMALYGEDSVWWRQCEATVMAGPADSQYLNVFVSTISAGGLNREHTMQASIWYNMLVSVPVPMSSMSDEYNPLSSYVELNNELNKNIEPDEPSTDPATEPSAESSTDPSAEQEAVVPESSTGAETTTEAGTNVNPADTGDTSQMGLYIALLAASVIVMGGAVIVIVIRKKRQS